MATRFKPGQSGNPGGRPKGLMSYIREQTKDGRELADAMLKVLRGEEIALTITRKVGGTAVTERAEVSPTVDQRIDAARWLADYGFGKVTFKDDDDEKGRTLIVQLGPQRDPLTDGGEPEQVLDVAALPADDEVV